MSFFTKMLLLFCACFLATASAPPQEAPIYYKVTMQIERSGKVLGQPILIMKPGASAIMTAANGDYSIKTSTSTNGGVKSSSINVSTELYLSHNGRWELFAKPNIFAEAGRSVDMTYDGAKYGQVVLTYKVEVVNTLATNVSTWGKNACSDKRISEWKSAMRKPVSFLTAKKPGQVIKICCSPCAGVSCCSAGPVCCADPVHCGNARCCSDPPA